jgi:hypothetical protein
VSSSSVTRDGGVKSCRDIPVEELVVLFRTVLYVVNQARVRASDDNWVPYLVGKELRVTPHRMCICDTSLKSETPRCWA